MSNFVNKSKLFLTISKNAPPLLAYTSRSLTSVAQGGGKYHKPIVPFDYYQHGWPSVYFLDRTWLKVNDNMKVVSVEGNMHVGKGLLAKKLAENFNMNFVRDTTDDDVFLLSYFDPPIDVRSHNVFLPDRCKWYDLNMLMNDPNPIKNGKPLRIQHFMHVNRFWFYAKAMCHLFSTGQGFVSERSPFTDVAFAAAMHHTGMLSDSAYEWFVENVQKATMDLWKPHIIIHLQAPIDYVRREIEKSNHPLKKSRNLTDKFLESYQVALDKWVDSMTPYCEIYPVDLEKMNLNDPEDVDLIVREISTIDLEPTKLSDVTRKFYQWRDGMMNRDCMDASRSYFTTSDFCFFRPMAGIQMSMDMHEARHSSEDIQLIQDVMRRDPRMQSFDGSDKKSVMESMFDFKSPRQNFKSDQPREFLFY